MDSSRRTYNANAAWQGSNNQIAPAPCAIYWTVACMHEEQAPFPGFMKINVE